MQVISGTLRIKRLILSHYLLKDNEDRRSYRQVSGYHFETHYYFTGMNLLSSKPTEVLRANIERWTIY